MVLDMVDIAQEIYSSSKRLQNSGDALFALVREYAEEDRKIYKRGYISKNIYPQII